MIGGIFIGIFFSIIFFIYYKLMHMHTKPHKNAIRADELKSLSAPGIEKTIDIGGYMEDTCKNCRFFDGYDVCDYPGHFGTVIQNTVDYCYRDRDFDK